MGNSRNQQRKAMLSQLGLVRRVIESTLNEIALQKRREKGKVRQQRFREKARNLAIVAVNLTSSCGMTPKKIHPAYGKCIA